jgi:DNA-binding NarL/FixJ family response regulator
MIAIAKFLAEERRQAVAEAVGRGRSRRDIAAVVGLSVARVQQIVKGR